MFNKLKERAKITEREPTFKVRYIGQRVTYLGLGQGCTTTPVQTLWDNSEEEHFLRKLKVKITPAGIQIKYLDKKNEPNKMFGIENISFCNVDTPVNDRIFSWLYREADDEHFECHAVVCSSTEKAKTMALLTSRAFQIAYKEWKSKQTKCLREKVKHRSVSLYAVPDRKKHELTTLSQSDVDVETAFSVMEKPGKINTRMSVDETLLSDNSRRMNIEASDYIHQDNGVEKL